MKSLPISSRFNRKPLCAAIVVGLVTISTPALVAVAQSTANLCAVQKTS